ncbi:GAF and ANTAR domain-containing protein [Arthrobacter zhaoxinii]|uniref:GAF and ANTAR domain-containing protein n=1 Tax=Arthrobacter zhaoxinii TaxID=2964616 RepID=A0ABY5YRN8_9MICC|nr:GAF and ANTAR domain-containing protein [Arthrobacter zhaoxinii]UWX97475.1 GAF and ANTAR domain-containing protein [Arthrobacter zhaoxinii]
MAETGASAQDATAPWETRPGRSAEDRKSTADDLDLFLVERLQDLTLSSVTVQEFLHELAALTAKAFSIPASPVECAMTITRDHKPVRAAFSGAPSGSLDDLQYDFTEGPCLTAIHERTLVHIPDLHREKRWEQYAGVLEQAGMRSVLVLPLDLETDGVATLSLYSARAGHFDTATVEQIQDFARRITKPVRLAARLAAGGEHSADLRAAMDSRTVIDLAVGIVMAQNRCSQDEAFTMLVSASGSRNIKLRQIAERVVGSVSETEAQTHFRQ